MQRAMWLVINATEIGRQRGGNESFMAGLIEGLAALDSRHEVVLLTCRWEQPHQLPSRFRQIDMGEYRRLPFFLWQQTRALRRLDADWYVSTFFLPLIPAGQGAVFVHDLSFRAHPDYFPAVVALYMRWLTGLAIRQAKRVLTISEFSRQELLRFYAVNSDKVAVVPAGVASRFFSAGDPSADQRVLSSYGITGPYILAVGNIHPRKNLSRLLDAYVRLQQERQNVPHMVWAGIQRWDSGPLLDRARLAGVMLPGFIAAEDLPALYRQAAMLAYPSLYEGFGMPPLEAMACGTPVLTSCTTSLPEVVGDAALTVDPTDVAGITDAMTRLLDDSSLVQQLREAGRQRAGHFSWTNAARQLLEVLSS